MIGNTRHSCPREKATRCSHPSPGLCSCGRAWAHLALVSQFNFLVFMHILGSKDVYIINVQGFSLSLWLQMEGGGWGRVIVGTAHSCILEVKCISSKTTAVPPHQTKVQRKKLLYN